MRPVIVVHAGTKSPIEWSDGCAPAVQAGMRILDSGGDALSAVVATTKVLEDDGRFNAGRGSCLRLDGKTIEMDAAVMDSDGRLGAVAAMRGFRFPIEAARAVMDTPHVLLAGEGASHFARLRGLEPSDGEPTEETRKRHERAVRMLREGTSRRPAWRDGDLAAIWNFPGPLPEELTPNDTVGAVARDKAGRFAAANSTGGAVPMMLGRVGDSPIPGAGFWAGPAGAVATTGIGEEIIRRLGAFRIYDLMESGATAAEALREVTDAWPEHFSFGAVAAGRDGHGIAANRSMAGADSES